MEDNNLIFLQQKKILHNFIDHYSKIRFLKENENNEYEFGGRKWRITIGFFEKSFLKRKLAILSFFNWLSLQLYLGKFQILNFTGEFLL